MPKKRRTKTKPATIHTVLNRMTALRRDLNSLRHEIYGYRNDAERIFNAKFPDDEDSLRRQMTNLGERMEQLFEDLRKCVSPAAAQAALVRWQEEQERAKAHKMPTRDGV